MKVVLASKNRHKWEEIRKITEKFDMELVMESDLGVDIDVEETGTTFEENSFLKANAVMRATGLPALADDSGIAVDALNGEPGIYSARYGFDDTLDDWGRLQLLLKNTENVPDGQRQAQFVCVITMVTPEGKVIQARGEVHGELLRAPAGTGGFGGSESRKRPAPPEARVPKRGRTKPSLRSETVKPVCLREKIEICLGRGAF